LRGGAHAIQSLAHGTGGREDLDGIRVPDLLSAQRVGDRVGQTRGRPSDQAAQVTGAGEQLAAAQAKVGVGEDFRHLGGQADACKQPGELLRRQIGVGDDLLPGGGRDRRGQLGQIERQFSRYQPLRSSALGTGRSRRYSSVARVS
jgi:hypothetical protein